MVDGPRLGSQGSRFAGLDFGIGLYPVGQGDIQGNGLEPRTGIEPATCGFFGVYKAAALPLSYRGRPNSTNRSVKISSPSTASEEN